MAKKLPHTRSAVRVRSSVVVRTAVFVAAAAVLSAAAAFATLRFAATKLTLSVIPMEKNPITVSSGSQGVPALTLAFQAGTDDLLLEGIMLGFFADDDGDFTRKIVNDVPVSRLISSCRFLDGTSPASDPVAAKSQMKFVLNDVLVPAQGTKLLQLTCDLVSQPPQGQDPDIFAFTLANAQNVLARVAVKGGNTLKAQDIFLGLAGSLNARGQDAAVLVKEASAPVISLASGTPSGSGIPGREEVLRFNISTNPTHDISLQAMTFKIFSTDQAGTGWNQCGADNLVTASRLGISLRNLLDPTDPFPTSMAFGNGNGGPCKSGDVLRYVHISFNSFQISGGQTHAFSLRLDTSRASASGNDVLRVDIPAESEIKTLHSSIIPFAFFWKDIVAQLSRDGSNVKYLPITGGTISY